MDWAKCNQSFAVWPHRADPCHPFSPLCCCSISHGCVSLQKWQISIYCGDYAYCNNSFRCTPEPWFAARLSQQQQRGHLRIYCWPERLYDQGPSRPAAWAFVPHQLCSHVEIITCLLAVFALSHTDWIITYSSFVQRHCGIMQMIIVMDLDYRPNITAIVIAYCGVANS